MPGGPCLPVRVAGGSFAARCRFAGTLSARPVAATLTGPETRMHRSVRYSDFRATCLTSESSVEVLLIQTLQIDKEIQVASAQFKFQPGKAGLRDLTG